MSTRLVWVPHDSLAQLGNLDERLEVLETPGAPLADGRLREVEVLVPTMRADIRPFIDRMTNLKLVQCASAGVDAIVDQVPSHVTLCSARGALDTHVSEWVITAILSSLKEFPYFYGEQQGGRWTRKPVALLAGARVLLFGYGSIARAVEERLLPFSPVITRIARHARPGVLPFDALEEALASTDVLVVLVPLTSETRGVLDRAALGRLPDGALVVNAARGRVVDSDALVDELRAGRLRAALDVTDPEPLPAGHPLYSAPGVIITPHVSWWTVDGMKPNYEVVARQLKRYADGQPMDNVVRDGY